MHTVGIVIINKLSNNCPKKRIHPDFHITTYHTVHRHRSICTDVHMGVVIVALLIIANI